MPAIAVLLAKLGYDFHDPALLECALTHRSADKLHNERLEFLGDAVLNLAITTELFARFPAADEGDLSRLRAQLVKGETLGAIAAALGLGDYIHLGSGELKSGGFRRVSILADTLEAIIGAIYLDGGIGKAQAFVLHTFTDLLAATRIDATLKDPKTRLQELLQARGLALPDYQVVQTHGQAHNQIFEVHCRIPLVAEQIVGRGSSRRKAEQEAAQHALDRLQAALT
jgi:ribonuclease III